MACPAKLEERRGGVGACACCTGAGVINSVKSLEGIKALALGADANLAYAKSLGDYLILYLNQIGRIFAFNSYPGNIGYGGVFVISLAIYSFVKKDKIGSFLATWLF